MSKSIRFFYQPGWPLTLTIWSWIGTILLLALIVQLEIVSINGYSIGIFVLGLILMIYELSCHKIVLDQHKLQLKTWWPKKSRLIDQTTVQQIKNQPAGLLIITNELDYQPTQILLSKKAKAQLLVQLKTNHWPVQ